MLCNLPPHRGGNEKHGYARTCMLLFKKKRRKEENERGNTTGDYVQTTWIFSVKLQNYWCVVSVHLAKSPLQKVLVGSEIPEERTALLPLFTVTPRIILYAKRGGNVSRFPFFLLSLHFFAMDKDIVHWQTTAGLRKKKLNGSVCLPVERMIYHTEPNGSRTIGLSAVPSGKALPMHHMSQSS